MISQCTLRSYSIIISFPFLPFTEMSDTPKRRPSKRRRTFVLEDSSHGSQHTDSSDDFLDMDKHPSHMVDYSSAAKRSKTRNPYHDSYISFGFTWTGNPKCPSPLCILCHKKFANSSMIPSKMKRHLKACHSYAASKGAPYFRKLLKNQNKQSKTFAGNFSVNDKAQEASYLIAKLISQKGESYTAGENLIMPACKIIVSKIFGQDAVQKIENVSVSGNVICQRINHMSHDAEKVLCEKLENNKFSINFYISADISKKCHVITFVRFVNEGEIQENFLCYRELLDLRMKDLFHIMSTYMKAKGLSWNKCVGFCTYSDPSLVTYVKSFASLVKRTNHNITIQCFLHREFLVSRTLGHEMKEVFDNAINMVNFIKQKPGHCTMFKKLCESFDKECVNLLLHTEIRWLSRGLLLDRLYQLQNELIEYFHDNNRQEFAECFEDEDWLLKLMYLADIFYHINQLSKSMQDPGENILTSSDKTAGLKRKLNIWKSHVTKKNLDMFPLLWGVVNKEECRQISRLILSHLEELRKKIECYFPCISTQGYDWIRNPFCEATTQPENFTLREEEELCELQSDRTLKMAFRDLSLDKFWVSVKDKYPGIHRKALNILLQFSSSYTCEQAFSYLLSINNRDKNTLVSAEDEIRVCLSKEQPRLEYLCNRNPSTTSKSNK